MKSPQYQLQASSTPWGEIIAKFMKSLHGTKIIILYQIKKNGEKIGHHVLNQASLKFIVRFSLGLTKHQKSMRRLDYTITNQVDCFSQYSELPVFCSAGFSQISLWFAPEGITSLQLVIRAFHNLRLISPWLSEKLCFFVCLFFCLLE